MSKIGELSPKQIRFATEFIADFNGTQAAIRAGYSRKAAWVTASRLLRNAKIIEFVNAALKKIEDDSWLNKQWVINRLRENHDKSVQAIAVLDNEGTPMGEYRYEPSAVNRSLELLGKEIGMFRDRVEHSGSINSALELYSKSEAASRDAVRKLDGMMGTGAEFLEPESVGPLAEKAETNGNGNGNGSTNSNGNGAH